MKRFRAYAVHYVVNQDERINNGSVERTPPELIAEEEEYPRIAQMSDSDENGDLSIPIKVGMN